MGGKLWVAVSLSLSLALISPAAWGQDSGPSPGRSVSLFAGRLLPYGVYGVRNIYPYWGLRYGHRLSFAEPEYALFFVNDRSVRFYTASASLTFRFSYGDLDLIPYFGVDVHHYSGHTNIRQLPFVTEVGGHVGCSPLFRLGGEVYLRADFKLNYGPGNTLNVGGGLIYYY